MNDMWDEHTTGLMRVRWQEPVAMSETITRAADDVDHIAKRLKEIAEERAEAQRQSDPAVASGEYLDKIAKSWSLVRTSGEGDYSFRQRIIKAAGGEP